MSDPNTPPPVPTPEAQPPAPPVEGAAEGTGLAPHVAAGICAIFPLIGGIIFFVLEKKNPFVRFWAMQSIFFGGACFAYNIVMRIAAMIFGHIPGIGALLLALLVFVGLVVGLGIFVIWVITIIKAFSKVEWEIPVLGKLARKQLAGQKLF